MGGSHVRRYCDCDFDEDVDVFVEEAVDCLDLDFDFDDLGGILLMILSLHYAINSN